MKTGPPPIVLSSTALVPLVTPEQVVLERAALLGSFTSTEEFDEFAAAHGFTIGHLAARFVTALSQIAGIDYRGLLIAEIVRATDDAALIGLARLGPRLMMWSAGTLDDATVCAADGRVILHERFGPEARVTDLAGAAMAAARLAIKLAGDALHTWGGQAGILRLHVARCRGLDIPGLHRMAGAEGFVLELATVSVGNPAVQARGPALRRRIDLADLLLAIGDRRPDTGWGRER